VDGAEAASTSRSSRPLLRHLVSETMLFSMLVPVEWATEMPVKHSARIVLPAMSVFESAETTMEGTSVFA
jgi:hypothetical protein